MFNIQDDKSYSSHMFWLHRGLIDIKTANKLYYAS